MTLSRQYCKLCDIADFEEPGFLALARSILPERDPLTHIERKVWEFTMLALFMEEVGLMNEGTEALSVGAGDERILFWLANRIGRVLATDIYGEGDFSGNEADASMLQNPAAHAPFPYREDHLEVKWMDGRELELPSGSFDLVFTLSSIEHFGSPADIARSSREIGRVLKPGGYAVIVTECLARTHPIDAARRALGRRESDAFSARQLQKVIVQPSALRMLQPLDRSLSRRTWDHIVPADVTLWESSSTPYPMILMSAGRSVFTSVCLVLEKPR